MHIGWLGLNSDWATVLTHKQNPQSYINQMTEYQIRTLRLWTSPCTVFVLRSAESLQCRILTTCVIDYHRAHINDLENIIPFLFLGAVYSMIGPSLAVARLHFLVFFTGRVVHSIAYLLALRAPTRSLAYTVAQIPCVSMAVQILMATVAYA